MEGIILVNKPKDLTSRDVVNIVSKELNTKKTGHTGTLDPMATGVLILCVGKYTKVSELITSYNKEYIAEVVLGFETDTLDITGNVINTDSEINIKSEEIIKVIKSFMGKSMQQVPKYSAVKVNGKKLYEYARNNIDVELPKKEIEIFDIELIGDVINNKFKIKCSVSKGTYIRSLIRDIGYKLGTYATMTSLIRTKQGEFKLEDCNTLEEIKSNDYKLLSLEEVISIPIIQIDKNLEDKIKNGAILDKFFDDEIAAIKNSKGEIISIYKTYEKDNSKVKPHKMFI